MANFEIKDGVLTGVSCVKGDTLTIPNQVVEISEDAFTKEKIKIKRLVLPKEMNKIPSYAFGTSLASSVKEIVMPKKLAFLGERALSGCKSIKEIKIPLGITSIPASFFNNCDALRKIYLSDTVSKIECEENGIGINAEIIASKKNKHFVSIDGLLFDKAMTTLLHCFSGKRGKVILPDTVTKIGNGAFIGCDKITEVCFSRNVTEIGNSAFTLCSKLKRINDVSCVNKIGEFAFAECVSLSEFSIPDGMTTIEVGTFYECSLLRKVSISESVKRISSIAFSGCVSLRNVTLPNSLDYIGESAFSECYKASPFIVPKNTKEISEYAFGFDARIKAVVLGNPVINDTSRLPRERSLAFMDSFDFSEINEKRSALLARLRELNINDTFDFGRFSPKNDGNDITPINWIVLDKVDNHILATTTHAVYLCAYTTERRGKELKRPTHEFSYMNFFTTPFRNGFMNSFNAIERLFLLPSFHRNVKNKSYSKYPFFLLSEDDVAKYLTDKDLRLPLPAGVDRRAFDESERVFLTLCDIDNPNDECAKVEAKDGNVAWWLRNDGRRMVDSLKYITCDGKIGTANGRRLGIAIRPAVWLDLDEI